MKNKPVAAIGALAFVMFAPSLWAETLVSTINGYYDVDYYDTPSLHISNTTGFDFTNVQMLLTGYQGLNNGFTQDISLPNITANSTYIYTWFGSTTAHNLSAYDYDDEFAGTAFASSGYPGQLPYNSVCDPQASIYGTSYCADTGNFYVTFTALWNGTPIYSQFSPTDNATNSFVGWEALDPNGWSETTYDSHNNGGPNGVLANIYVGTPPPITTPEPGTLMLLGTGFVAFAGAMRRKWLI